MVFRKFLRRGVLVFLAALLALYFFRWSLFEGRVRRELNRVVEKELGARFEADRLEGSLVSSITAHGIVLLPGPKSPFIEATVRRVRARYGLFGLGGLRLEIEGAFVAPGRAGGPPAPLHKTLRDGLEDVPGLRLPGTVKVRSCEIRLLSGRTVRIDEARAKETDWWATGVAEGWGDVEARARVGRNGAISVEATASEAPVPWVSAELGERVGGLQPARIETRYQNQPVVWAGSLHRNSQGGIVRAEGAITLPQGEGRASLDLMTGEAEIFMDGAISLRDPVVAEVKGKGTARGPLEGPIHAWKCLDLAARAPKVSHGDLVADAVDVTLVGESWTARAVRDGVRAEARGKIAWGERPWVEGSGILVGTPFAPEVKASGRISLEDGAVSARIDAGDDRVTLDGTISSWGFEGDFKVDGPCAWLKGVDVSLPARLRPARLEGSMAREKEGARIKTKLALGEFLSAESEVAVGRREGLWRVDVAPGEFLVDGRHRVRLGGFAVGVAPHAITLGNVRVELEEPGLAADLSGSARWGSGEVEAEFDVRRASVGGEPVPDLAARGKVERGTGDVVGDVAWGKEGDDRLTASGRLGEVNDFKAVLRVHDFDRPLVRRLIGETGLRGGLALELQVTGTAGEPEGAGTLALRGLSAAGAPPIDLEIPIRLRDRAFHFEGTAEGTPYGRLALRGTIPLRREPLEISADFETFDLAPLLGVLPEEARGYVPKGSLKGHVEMTGLPEALAWQGTAEFQGARYAPPAPLGEVTDLRARARLDAEGLHLEELKGEWGRGPFRAEGLWKLWEAGRPLRIEASGEDLLIVSDRLSRARAKAEVILSGTDDEGWLVSGTVGIPLAIYHREFARGTGGGVPGLRFPAAPKGGVRVPGLRGMEKLKLDLKVVAHDEVRVENSAVAVLLEGEGRARGTAAVPELSGRVRVRRGEVKLATGVFVEIVSAEAVFPGELGREPTIRFEGRVGRGQGEITVFLTGPLASPSLNLTSDPPRSQRELLSMVAFGQEPGAMSGDAALGTVAVRVFRESWDAWPTVERSEDFFDDLWERLAIGVEGSDPIGRRSKPWDLPPSGTARGTVVRTEYIWTPLFSIIAETDSGSSVSGDVKLRVRFW